MSRYRPPQPRSSPYITRAGFEALQAEEKAIWQRRKVVTAALSAAAAEGDRSENAEYIYRKKELREIDRRIRYLQKRLPDLKVIDRTGDGDKVYFGATVELVDDSGETSTVRIVGADEINPKLKHISIDSPVARALLGKSIDDAITLDLPTGAITYDIVDIEYD